MIGPITAEDVGAGFRSGVHPLDDYFARHALPNDRAGVSRCFVLRPESAELPVVCDYYTPSMASVQADSIRAALKGRKPRYPLLRVVRAGERVGCVGIIVDAKDEGAERFYGKYDFTTVEADAWPRRMFLTMATARAAVGEG